jgi:ATP/maltotriose-dependent transcriptional regulator MalT
VDQGLELAQGALAACLGSLQFMTLMPLANVTRLLIMKGDLPAAQEHLDWCFREDHGFLSYFNMSMLVLQAAAELAFAQGNDLAAVDYADQQLVRLRESRMLPYQADALHLKALAQSRMGRHSEAESTLRQGIEIAESLGARRMLWRLYGALAAVLDAQGRSDEAKAARAQSAAIIDYLITQIDQPDLRESFLNLPEVQRLKTNS